MNARLPISLAAIRYHSFIALEMIKDLVIDVPSVLQLISNCTLRRACVADLVTLSEFPNESPG